MPQRTHLVGAAFLAGVALASQRPHADVESCQAERELHRFEHLLQVGSGNSADDSVALGADDIRLVASYEAA